MFMGSTTKNIRESYELINILISYPAQILTKAIKGYYFLYQYISSLHSKKSTIDYFLTNLIATIAWFWRLRASQTSPTEPWPIFLLIKYCWLMSRPSDIMLCIIKIIIFQIINLSLKFQTPISIEVLKSLLFWNIQSLLSK